MTFPAVFNVSNLNGTNGFVLPNSYGSGPSGVYSVSVVGDVNGDGLQDIIIGSPNYGLAYVIFGVRGIIATPFCFPDNINGNNGFILSGNNNVGYSVSKVGDINVDGIDDILIGAPAASPAGVSYVIFGSATWPSEFDLSNLNGTNGFTVNGINSGDQSGQSVSGAGDVNGDGIQDILIGASLANRQSGQSYVIFGNTNVIWPAVINLASLNGTNGFAINGTHVGGWSGYAASGVGDVNHDGIDDILIGAPRAFDAAKGQSYVIFGSSTVWPASMGLASLNGRNGFALNGINDIDRSGSSVSGAGDINGDGIDDILIGTPWANSQTGQSYVVFGSGSSWPASMGLASLNGRNGFALNGVNSGDRSGTAVGGVGDINGDHIDDIFIGAPWAINQVGQSYIIYGSTASWPAALSFAALDGRNGFTIEGINIQDQIGSSGSAAAGDINGDGLNDILIGAINASNAWTNCYCEHDGPCIGQAYLLYGQS